MGNCWVFKASSSRTATASPSNLSRVGTSQTTSNTTSSSLSSSMVAGSNFSASSGDAPEPSSPQGHILPLPNLRIFTVAELKAATKNFRSDWLLGEGGFGRVYKGWIEEKSPSRNSSGSGSGGGGGLVIAIKKLNSESVQGLQEWRAEVDFLGRLSHPNLVKLLGYCSEDEELLLVYEYMQKGSLEHHLFGRGATVQPLPWDTRLKILIGAARGLAFLHTPETQVIYRDFKASNILLDPSYNAKISDFGLAKTGPTESKSHVTTRVIGTYGYAAPEYVATGHLYVKSDVFAFGVVLIEMLTGLRAVDRRRPNGQETLIDWIIPYLLNKRKLKTIMDSKLEGKYPSDTAYQIAQVALKCLASEPKNRPSMEEVLKVLEKADVSNVERHKEPKTHSARPGGQVQRPVQLPTPPRSPLTPPRSPLTPPPPRSPLTPPRYSIQPKQSGGVHVNPQRSPKVR